MLYRRHFGRLLRLVFLILVALIIRFTNNHSNSASESTELWRYINQSISISISIRLLKATGFCSSKRQYFVHLLSV